MRRQRVPLDYMAGEGEAMSLVGIDVGSSSVKVGACSEEAR